MQKIRLSKNHKFRTKQKFNKIKPLRFYLGILICIISAFAIYSFTFISREALRLFSRTDDCDIWTFTDSEMSFYNFFFAFISVVFAQSLIINFWLNKNRSFFGRYEYKRQQVVNEQRTFNWIFIAWFSKVAFVYVIFFSLTFPKGYYTINFYEEYLYVFILIMIIIFLQAWNSLRIVFLKNSLLKMLTFAIILSSISFGISKINIIDYKHLDNTLKETCCEACIPKDIPKVKHCKKNRQRRDIIYMNNKTINSKDSLIKYSDKVLSINEFSNIIKNNKLQNRYYQRVIFKLFIDKKVKMKHVNNIKTVLAKNKIRYFEYAVLPKKIKYPKKYYYEYGIPTRINISYYNDSVLNRFFIPQSIREEDNFIMKADSFGNIFIDNIAIKNNNLTKIIKEKIVENKDIFALIEINDEMKFGTYFKMWYAYYEAITELREDYSTVYFTEKYEDLTLEEQYKIMKKYPFNHIDMTERMKLFLKQQN